MKKQHKLVTLVTILLLSTPLSHAMGLNPDPQAEALAVRVEKAARDRSDSSSSNDSDCSDSEITEPDNTASPAPPDESPVDSYIRALSSYWTEWKKNDFDDEGSSYLQKMIMLPKPEDQSATQRASKTLTIHILNMLDKMFHKSKGVRPNQINPETGNTALADFFINHHVNNFYLHNVVEAMGAYKARLDDITHDHRDFSHLVHKALLDYTLTTKQCYSLLHCSEPRITAHLRGDEALQETFAERQALAEEQAQLQKALAARQALLEKQARQLAKRRAMRWQPKDLNDCPLWSISEEKE